jgi:hypothetical protein
VTKPAEPATPAMLTLVAGTDLVRELAEIL